MFTDAESRLLGAIDDRETVRSLAHLIAVPSVGGSDAEVDIQIKLAGQLAEQGLDIDMWPMDLNELAHDLAFPGVEVERQEAWGVVGSSRPDETPALVLQAHVDVVPAGDPTAWSSDPFTPVVTAETVLGRGSCDMKGGLAAILGAVRAVTAARVRLDRGFAVHCAIGEEDGGLGAFGTLGRGHGGEACIIPEPTGNRLVTANAGALTFRVEVPGLATHGSTPYAGSSALDSYVAIHAALADLGRSRNLDPEALMASFPVAYPLVIGRVRAGDWASSVPDLLVAEGRLGLRIEEDPSAARLELEQVVADAAGKDAYLKDHLPRVSWLGGQFRGGRLPAGHALAPLVGTAHADVTGSQPPPERGAPWGSDLRLYAGAGIPTLHYGPGDVRLAHGPNESVPITDLLTCTRVLALAILRRCGQLD